MGDVKKLSAEPPIRHLHPGIIQRWVDGDTVWITVDLDYRLSADLDYRLYGINCAEHGTPAGTAATARVNELAPVGTAIQVESFKSADGDNFGRWLADIVITATGININQELVAEGLALPYFGTGPRPVPAWPLIIPGAGS